MIEVADDDTVKIIRDPVDDRRLPLRRTASGCIHVGDVQLEGGWTAARTCPSCGGIAKGRALHDRTRGKVFTGRCPSCQQGVRTEHREG